MITTERQAKIDELHFWLRVVEADQRQGRTISEDVWVTIDESNRRLGEALYKPATQPWPYGLD